MKNTIILSVVMVLCTMMICITIRKDPNERQLIKIAAEVNNISEKTTEMENYKDSLNSYLMEIESNTRK